MKKSQRSSHGTAPSTRHTRSQSRAARPAKTETISRFFKKRDKSEDKINQSIYKDAVTEIGETHPSQSQHDTSDGDFVSPKPPRKVAKIFAEVKEANKRATRARSSRRKKSSVSKEEEKLNAIGRSADVNMEHLQLAMALSKSMEPELCDAQEDAENIFPSTQQIVENTKVALSGFKLPTTKPKNNQNLSARVNNLVENAKSRKKSKFRHVKPKLFTRTTEDRERLIQEKIALILSYSISASSQQDEIIIHSDVLRDIASQNRRCFSLSHQVDKNRDAYFVEGLGVEKSGAVCGCLLKDWGLIAGRDKSPERVITSVQTNESDHVKIVAATEVKQMDADTDINSDDRKVLESQNDSDVNATQGSFSTTKSCSSYFSAVSHASRKLIRSVSPDLFASSDEEMVDEVFGDARSQLTIDDVKYNEPNRESLANVERFKDGAGKETSEDLTAQSDVGCLTFEPAAEVINVEKEGFVNVLSNVTIIRPHNQEEEEVEKTPERIETNDDNEIENDNESKQSQNKLAMHYKHLNDNHTSLNDSDQNYEMDDRGICTYESFCDYDEHGEPNSNDSVDSVRSGLSEELLYEVSTAVDVSAANECPEEVTNQDTDVLIDGAPAQGFNVDNDEEEIKDMENKNEDVITSKLDDSSFNYSANNDTITSEFGKSFAPMNVTSHVHALLNSDTFYNEHKSVCIEKYFNSPGIKDKTFEKTSEEINMSTEEVQSHRELEDFPEDVDKDKMADNDDLRNISQDKIDCIDLSQDSDHENHEQKTSSEPQNNPRMNSSLQRHVSSKSLDSTTSTNDSICISDEELNYSCLNATPRAAKGRMSWRFEKLAYKNNKYAISDSDNEDEDFDDGGAHNDGGNEVEESINVTKLLRALQEKKLQEIEHLSQENLKEDDVIVLSDKENEENSEDDEELQEALRLSLVEAENEEKGRLSQDEGGGNDCTDGMDGTGRENDEEEQGKEFHDSFPSCSNIHLPENSLFEMSRRKASGRQDGAKVVDQQNGDLTRDHNFDNDSPSFSNDVNVDIPENSRLETSKREISRIQDGGHIHNQQNGDLPHDKDFDDSFPSFSKDHTNLRKNSCLGTSSEKISSIQEVHLQQNGGLHELNDFGESFPSFKDNFTNISRRHIRDNVTNTKHHQIEDDGELKLENVDLNEKNKSNTIGTGDTTILQDGDLNISNKISKNWPEDVECDEIDLENEEVIGSVSINMDTEPHINYSFPSFDYDNYDHCRPSLTMRQYQSPEIDKTSERTRNKSFISTSTTTDNEVDEFDLLVNPNISKPKVDKLPSTTKPQVPRRVQELIYENTPKKSFNKSNRQSGTFEDTFANLLEQTNVMKNLERIETHETGGNGSNDNLKTPPGNKKLQCAGSGAPTTPVTPADGLYVKSDNITPMPMYDVMTTPEIHAELDKIGVKRMKRRRGVLMLKHVYNSMHLQLEKQDVNEIGNNDQGNVDGSNVEKPEVDLDELNRPQKRRKRLNYDSQDGGDGEVATITPRVLQAGEIETSSKIAESESLEDMIFERMQSKRIKSCALPFHIAWHNFLCVHRDIWENVLLYEPLQVEVLYAMFKDLGFKYHMKDMIAFFDKKCITIRIKQNN